jgi:hypothetical protein
MEMLNMPMVEVFKTDIQNGRQATVILKKLGQLFPKCRINFDLSDCDKILRVEGTIASPEKIIEVVTTDGFKCELLE